ncbi:MAG: tail fiber domain-containing protein, partial [Candidatus Pacebacteria bacterium]|nr:tail fiber domain-containing protein [Candidatus Paceibacterota bacterium]
VDKLDVNGMTYSNGLKLRNTYGNSYVGLYTNASDFGLTIQTLGGYAFKTFYNGAYVDSLHILNNGNIGIGTTSPFAKLSVTGTGTGTGSAFQVADSANSPKFTVLDNGNVGVGITGPLGKLDIKGGITSVRNGIFGVSSEQIRFGRSDVDTNIRYHSIYTTVTNTSASGNKMNFLLHNVVDTISQSNIMTLQGDGNVGIGTTTPFAKLSIHANNGETNTTLFNIASSTASATTSLFAVLNNGNVGVGTASPSEMLHLYSNTSAVNQKLETGGSGYSINFQLDSGSDANLILDRGATSRDARIILRTVGTTNFHIGLADDGDSNFYIGNENFVNKWLTVSDGTGNVGIGTTTPWRTLSVNGTAAFTGLTNDGTGYYACISTSGELATSTTACGASSERFKTNINDLTYGLDTVLQLRPVSFNWKSDFINSSSTQIGFIAEEVNTLIPEVIGHDDKGTIMNLDYPKLTSVLVNAIKEINTKISAIASSTPTVSTGVVDSVLSHLESLGAKFVDGIAYFKDVVVKTLTAEKVVTNGIEMVDEVTGEIYCVRIQNGAMVNIAGACDTVDSSQSTVDSTATYTAPIITVTGNNPATIIIGSTYADLGATAVDSQGHSLIVDTIDADKVDTTTAGEYIVTYTVFDGTNTATSTRTVIVEELIVDSLEPTATPLELTTASSSLPLTGQVTPLETTTVSDSLPLTGQAEPVATTTEPVVDSL